MFLPYCQLLKEKIFSSIFLSVLSSLSKLQTNQPLQNFMTENNKDSFHDFKVWLLCSSVFCLGLLMWLHLGEDLARLKVQDGLTYMSRVYMSDSLLVCLGSPLHAFSMPNKLEHLYMVISEWLSKKASRRRFKVQFQKSYNLTFITFCWQRQVQVQSDFRPLSLFLSRSEQGQRHIAKEKLLGPFMKII